ncbi:MAG: right-handed parallel beta-helix repeat-containing protein, partial [Pedobacter sp.]
TFYTDAEGTNPWFDYSIGIFLDDCVENVDIQNNTIFGHTQWGVFLHAANQVTFKGNTLFDNRVCQIVLYHNGGNCPIRGDIIKQNIFVAKSPTQMVAQIESNADDLLQYGTIDSNFYARPFNEEATIRGVINSVQGGNFNLAGWQSFSGGQDLHSKTSPITYQENNADGAGGTNRVYSTFDQDSNGWEIVYSRYGNAAIALDNTNKLDGGSVRFAFPTPSGQTNSYAQLVKRVGVLKKGKKYVLRFDAIASANVSLLVHLRTYGPPFTEFGRRYYVSLDSTRQSFELIYDVADDASDAIIMMQTDVEGPVIWIDNVRLQEDVLIGNNPDDFIKLINNPTLKDSTIVLPAGSYRDVYNVSYTNSLQLKPFTSAVLFREPPVVSPADLSISLETDKRVLRVNEISTFRLRIRNQSETPASLARWTSRLPANMEFVVPSGQIYNDNVLTGI